MCSSVNIISVIIAAIAVVGCFFAAIHLGQRISDGVSVLERSLRYLTERVDNHGTELRSLWNFLDRRFPQSSRQVRISGTVTRADNGRVMPWAVMWDRKKEIQLRFPSKGKLRFTGCSGPALVTYVATGQTNLQGLAGAMPVECLNHIFDVDVDPATILTIQLMEA